MYTTKSEQYQVGKCASPALQVAGHMGKGFQGSLLSFLPRVSLWGLTSWLTSIFSCGLDLEILSFLSNWWAAIALYQQASLSKISLCPFLKAPSAPPVTCGSFRPCLYVGLIGVSNVASQTRVQGGVCGPT